MDEERLIVYLTSLDEPIPPYLSKVREEALLEGVPIVRDDTGMLLKFLMKDRAPQQILEIGTAVGFSAMLMAEYAPDAHVTTIENYPPRVLEARDRIGGSPYADRVTLIEGDALEVIKEFPDEAEFSFVFMDAAKGQYPMLLPYVKKHLSPHGMLLSDNVLFDGDIIESKYLIKRRNRTIHKRMREYLYELTHDPAFSTVILPVGDGVAMSVLIGGKNA